MYLSHYGLQKKPFDISPDPSFLWLGEKHREALSYLKYGIMENKGFLMITGDVGTGKTALLRCLTQQVDAENLVVAVSDPDMNRLDFFNFLADSLGMDRSFKSKGEFLIHFKRFLAKAYSQQQKILLIIDESQRLNHDLLQEIRLLSNIDSGGQLMLNIFFVGQTEFVQLLKQERCRTIRQRIAASFHLEPLESHEVKKYITHRLQCAGAENQIFTDEAIQKVYEHTAGYPRLINILCDHALMTGYAGGATAILPSMVDECAGELPVTFDNRSTEAAPEAGRQIEPEPDRSPSPAPESASPPHPAKKSKSTGEIITAATTKLMAVIPAESRNSFLRHLMLGFAALLMLAGAVYFAFGPVRGFMAARGRTDTGLSPGPTFESAGEDESNSPHLKPIEDTNLASTEPAMTEIFAAHVTAEANDDRRSDGLPGSTPATVSGNVGASTEMPASSDDRREVAGVDGRAVIFFNFNSYILPRKAINELVRLAGIALEYPGTKIFITGYTDSQGSYRANRAFSRIRAEIVRDFLVERGVPPENIEAIGKGAQNPIGNNSTSIGRRQNRRVEIEFRRPSTG